MSQASWSCAPTSTRKQPGRGRIRPSSRPPAHPGCLLEMLMFAKLKFHTHCCVACLNGGPCCLATAQTPRRLAWHSLAQQSLPSPRVTSQLHGRPPHQPAH